MGFLGMLILCTARGECDKMKERRFSSQFLGNNDGELHNHSVRADKFVIYPGERPYS